MLLLLALLAQTTHHDVEVLLGTTNIHAALGNGHLTAAWSDRGELTVLRWPNPTFHEHLQYTTEGGEEGYLLPHSGAADDDGGLDGVMVDGKVSWLRDAPWTARVRYTWDETDVLRREYSAPGRSVACTELVPATLPVLRRRCTLTGADTYVGYLNPSLATSHAPFDPTDQAYGDDKRPAKLRWDAAAGAFVDVRDGVVLAVGIDPAPEAVQCGLDGTPSSAFAGIAGATSADGSENLGFRVAAASVETTLAFGATEAEALGALSVARATPFDDAVAASEAESRAFLALAPRLADPDLDGFVRRTLLSVRTGTDPATGAIVASVSSQPPYSLDWPRDGTFFNVLWTRLGQTERVAQHNTFYVAAQRKTDGERAFDKQNGPAGSWAMNYFSDGVPGGPIDFEIDQTGFLLWTLATHTPELPGAMDAIRRAADLLTSCKDAATGLQCPASEDDHPDATQTLHGAITVWMGLVAAVKAAKAAGAAGWEPWDARRAELEAAIRQRWIRDDGTVDGDDGALSWAIWPAEFPMTDATRSALVARLLAHLEAALVDRAPAGSAYDGKLTMALATVLTTPSSERDRLDRVVRILATDVPTKDTRHLGEVYIPNGDGTWQNHTSQPHLWEATLVTLTLLERASHPDPAPAGEGGCAAAPRGAGALGLLAVLLLGLTFVRRGASRAPRCARPGPARRR